MRSIKRFINTQLNILQNIKRLIATKKDLEQFFNIKIDFKLEGAKGRDLIYLVKNKYSRENIAVARFSNQKDIVKNENQNLPFLRESAQNTISREYKIYNKLFLEKLSPQPLWVNESNTILCNSFINSMPIFEHLKKDFRLFWHYILKVMPYIKKMHDANVTHMDMSLNNILIDINDEMYFIDFEYAPDPSLSFSEQCLYDYLRLIESSVKYLPDDIFKEKDAVIWMNQIKKIFSDDRGIDKNTLNKLKPAIGRIYNNEDIYKMLCEITTYD